MVVVARRCVLQITRYLHLIVQNLQFKGGNHSEGASLRVDTLRPIPHGSRIVGLRVTLAREGMSHNAKGQNLRYPGGRVSESPTVGKTPVPNTKGS